MRRHLLISLGVAASLGLGAYWYWSPYLALYEMRNAVRDRDPDVLNVHVDYPRLRESVKGQLSALLTQEMAKGAGADSDAAHSGAALGGLLGLALVDRLVDAVVRPEAMMQLMQKGKFTLGTQTHGTDDGTVAAAKMDISLLQQALKLYKLDHGAYPTQEQGLDALVDPTAVPGKHTGYLERLPKDPWGRPYQYRNPGSAPGSVDVTYLPPPAVAVDAPEASDEPGWQAERKDVDTLIVYPGKAGQSVQEKTGFVMTRQGFAQWKLTEVRLPGPAR